MRRFVPVFVLLVFAALAIFSAVWAPDLLATKGLTTTNAQEKLMAANDRAEEIGRIRTACLAVLAGGLAAIGPYYTHRTFELNRQTAAESHEPDQVRLRTERFTRAIDQLGNESLDVRLGGIYALEPIARDSKDDHPQVVEILTAYVREPRPGQLKSSSRTAVQPSSRTFAIPIEAVRALGRIATGDDPKAQQAQPRPASQPPTKANLQCPQLTCKRRLPPSGAANTFRDRPRGSTETPLRRSAKATQHRERPLMGRPLLSPPETSYQLSGAYDQPR